MIKIDQTTKIARLNDAFRTTLIGGQLMLTAGVQALDELTLCKVIQAVKTFNDFQ